MSVAYSVPPVRLKAVAGADWAINIVGVGVLTPFAGWSASVLPLRPEGRWIMIGFGFLFGSLYPLPRSISSRKTRARGDRTLARILGIDASLWISAIAAALAFLSFWHALFLAGPTCCHAIALLAVADAFWALFLVSWLVAHRRNDERESTSEGCIERSRRGR